jgi:3-oxoacyl-[acyl-carrier protein] reductase
MAAPMVGENAGARVIVHFGRNADEAKSVVDQIRATGGRADAVSVDLAAPNGAHELAAQVRNLLGDRLDIFVSNAGISNATAFENMTVKDFDNLFAVNVRAPYFLVQQLLPIQALSHTIHRFFDLTPLFCPHAPESKIAMSRSRL